MRTSQAKSLRGQRGIFVLQSIAPAFVGSKPNRGASASVPNQRTSKATGVR